MKSGFHPVQAAQKGAVPSGDAASPQSWIAGMEAAIKQAGRRQALRLHTTRSRVVFILAVTRRPYAASSMR